MASFFDNIRASWNGLLEKFEDPVKLAKLNVADLKKALTQAEQCAASVVGRPVVLKEQIMKAQRNVDALHGNVTTLIQAGDEANAQVYLDQYNTENDKLQELKDELAEAEPLAEQMREKILFLKKEIANRERGAHKAAAEMKAADAEIKLGKQTSKMDSLLGTGTKLDDAVAKKKAEAAGYAAMSGTTSTMMAEKALRDAKRGASLAAFKEQNGMGATPPPGSGNLSLDDFK